MEDRYTYEKLIEKYGNPIIEYEIVPIEFLMSFEDEAAEKPYKVAIFKNIKNILGFTVCATYQQKENPEWYINAGSKWLIKYLIMDLKNTEDYNGKIIDENMQLKSYVANFEHKINLLEEQINSMKNCRICKYNFPGTGEDFDEICDRL